MLDFVDVFLRGLRVTLVLNLFSFLLDLPICADRCSYVQVYLSQKSTMCNVNRLCRSLGAALLRCSSQSTVTIAQQAVG